MTSGWEDFFSNPARAAEIKRENERLDRLRKQAEEDKKDKELSDKALAVKILEDSAREDKLKREREKQEEATLLEKSGRYWEDRARNDWKEVHVTGVIPAEGDRPAYEFIVFKNPKSGKFVIDLIIVPASDALVIGSLGADMEPMYEREEFSDEVKAKARAEQLAETGVQWRAAR